MGNAVPVEHLLFFLRANAVVFVQKVQECALGLLESRIGAGFEISQVGEDALFKFLGVLHGTAKRLESESETTNDVGTRNVEEIAPGEQTWLALTSGLFDVKLGHLFQY